MVGVSCINEVVVLPQNLLLCRVLSVVSVGNQLFIRSVDVAFLWTSDHMKLSGLLRLPHSLVEGNSLAVGSYHLLELLI